MKIYQKIIALILTTLLISCTNPDGSPMTGNDFFTKENVGGLVGAAAGAWAGSNVGKGSGNTAAIAAGTLGGLLIGRNIGASLDRADQMAIHNTTQYSLENSKTGVATSWNNPDSGNNGQITPVRTYQVNQSYCREFTQTINIGGKTEEAYGTACRREDGTWEIQ